MAKFYLTTAIPYVNAKPHVGHALEFVQADVIARFHRIIGDDVLLLSGADENALKNVQAAQIAKIPIQEFVDSNSQLFLELAKKLNIQFDIFQKGSNPDHHASSQVLWQSCFESGDIYKKEYGGLYCIGCEQFYEQEELDEKGECYEHPGKKLEKVLEENYFFKLSKYETQLSNLVEMGALEIIPESRKNETLSFISKGLKDISISRTNKRAKNWGVSIPQDPTQKIYVWFDALNIYQSGIGFGRDDVMYKKWWPADLHIIGKGILRFHAIYWPAFLLSAKLPLPKAIFVHGYFTVNGQKMSKTLGNVIDPIEFIDEYGADALRYFFLREISPTADGDFSERRLKEVYNADLANGLGNLVSRIAKLCESSDFVSMGSKTRVSGHIVDVEGYSEALSAYKFNEALGIVFEKIARADKFIDQEKPWGLLKSSSHAQGTKLREALAHLVDRMLEISALLEPFMPETAQKIEEQFKSPKILSQPPLFPRVQ